MAWRLNTDWTYGNMEKNSGRDKQREDATIKAAIKGRITGMDSMREVPEEEMLYGGFQEIQLFVKSSERVKCCVLEKNLGNTVGDFVESKIVMN